MFGGKTELMIARLRHARTEGLRVAAFKHAIDNRYDPDHLVTHTQDRFDAVRVPDAAEILKYCLPDKAAQNPQLSPQGRGSVVDFIAIDEGHFFKLALIPIVRQLLDAGISIVVAGITHDAWGRPFEPMPQLCEIASSVVQKQAPCRVCGEPSPYTQRMTRVNTIHMVGGLDDYEPRCRAHFQALTIPVESR